MAQMNESPEEYWNQEAGARWVRAQPLIDRMMQPLTDELYRRAAAQEGEQVLDIGCGAGTTSLAFAEQVGSTGGVWGVDIAQPMIEGAKARASSTDAPDRAPLAFSVEDAQESDFAGKQFDLLTSRFGIMFFVDQQRAFSNLQKALKPGGRMLAMCWQAMEQNPWLYYVAQGISAFDASSIPAPEAGPGPFRLADAEKTKQLLASAGFVDVKLHAFETKISLGADAEQALQLAAEIGPFSRMLSEAEPAARAALVSEARAYLSAAYAAGPTPQDAAVWLIEARRA